MTNIFTDADFLAAYKQKQKNFYLFLKITGIYLAVCCAFWFWFMSMPYGEPLQWIPHMLIYIWSGVYVILTYPYMYIRYGRSNRYYKMLLNIGTGLKDVNRNYFYKFRDKYLSTERMDVQSAVMERWNKKSKEWTEREAYVDIEKEKPDFQSGDIIEYVTQGNFIIQYEILVRGAVEFEEIFAYTTERDEEEEEGYLEPEELEEMNDKDYAKMREEIKGEEE